MGLGSVAYIFVLSALIWILALPLRPERWSYLSVLTFVGLTSPLAWLYAIPVERFVSMDFAISANVLFLADPLVPHCGISFAMCKSGVTLSLRERETIRQI